MHAILQILISPAVSVDIVDLFEIIRIKKHVTDRHVFGFAVVVFTHIVQIISSGQCVRNTHGPEFLFKLI